MGVGTAGYTAMLCVLALGTLWDHAKFRAGNRNRCQWRGRNRCNRDTLEAWLSSHASTGRVAESGFLKELGAAEIIDRAELSEPGRPLGKERWAAGVDAVGSHTLANVLAQTQYGGAVAACGLAQGFDLPTTVMPFILRGVSLLGVDSVMASKELRHEAWGRIASDLDLAKLASLTTTIGFDDIIATASDIIDGKIRGRVIVDMS